MRFRGGIIASLVLLTGFSVSAQENTAQTGQGVAPEDDLDCALYTAGLLASDEGVMTPDARTALVSTMTYFLGRYESQRGTPISVALSERYPIYLESDTTQLEKTCGLRARGFARRMEDMGRVMFQIQAERQPPSEDPGAP